FAVREGRRLLKNGRFDAIYATHPTRTALLIGWSLSRSSGLPLVCDLRDPWFGGTHRKYFASLTGGNMYVRWLESWEGKIVRHASRVIVNTRQMKSDLSSRFPGGAGKIVHIPNGYDESDFASAQPRESARGKITFLHAGEIYPLYRDPRALLEAF